MSAQKTPRKRGNIEELDRNAQEKDGMDLDEDLNVILYSQDDDDDDRATSYLDFTGVYFDKRTLAESHIPQEGMHIRGYENCETTRAGCDQPCVKSEMEHPSLLWKETSHETFSVGSFGQIPPHYSQNAFSSNPCTDVDLSFKMQVAISGNTILDTKSSELEESGRGYGTGVMDAKIDLREHEKTFGCKSVRDVITSAHHYPPEKQTQQPFHQKNDLSKNSMTAETSKLDIPCWSETGGLGSQETDETGSLVSQGIDEIGYQVRKSTDGIEPYKNNQHQMKENCAESEVWKYNWYQMKESHFDVTEMWRNYQNQTEINSSNVSDVHKMDQYTVKKNSLNGGQMWKSDLNQMKANMSDKREAWKNELHRMKEKPNVNEKRKSFQGQIMENHGKSEAWKDSRSSSHKCLITKKKKDDYKKLNKRSKTFPQGSLPGNKNSTPTGSVRPKCTGLNFFYDEGKPTTGCKDKISPQKVTLGVENIVVPSSASPSKVKSKFETQRRSSYPFIAGTLSQNRTKDSFDRSIKSHSSFSYKIDRRPRGSWSERKALLKDGKSLDIRWPLPDSISHFGRQPDLDKETVESRQPYSHSTDGQNANRGILESSSLCSEMLQINFHINKDSCSSNKLKYDVRELQTKQYEPGFIDTHCHLDFLFHRISHSGSYRKFQLDSLDTDPFPVSYEGCVAIFCKPWTFRRITWWEKMISEANVWAAFGCHPHFSPSFGEEEECYLRHALQNSKTVALGEIGLDYSGKDDNHEVQQSVFRRQLKIAVELKKPIVIHCREAHLDCIEILKEIVPRDYLIHRHCFTETWNEAKEWMETFSRLYLGFTNLITYPYCRRSWNIQEVARRIPLNRLLLETDAPYFRPHCYSDSGKFSHPGMAIHVAAQVAVLRNEKVQDILKEARQNTRDIYGI